LRTIEDVDDFHILFVITLFRDYGITMIALQCISIATVRPRQW
jgi:hypothetical protein